METNTLTPGKPLPAGSVMVPLIFAVGLNARVTVVFSPAFTSNGATVGVRYGIAALLDNVRV